MMMALGCVVGVERLVGWVVDAQCQWLKPKQRRRKGEKTKDARQVAVAAWQREASL